MNTVTGCGLNFKYAGKHLDLNCECVIGTAQSECTTQQNHNDCDSGCRPLPADLDLFANPSCDPSLFLGNCRDEATTQTAVRRNGLKEPHTPMNCQEERHASAGNRTRVISMATMYSTTRPLMFEEGDISCIMRRFFG